MYTEGLFLKEDTHRFTCFAKVSSRTVSCYLPANCKLKTLINPENRKVLLFPYSTNKYDYILEAIKYRNSYYLVNLNMINQIIHTNLNKKLFSYLNLRSTSYREKTVDNYKLVLV